MIYTTAKRSFYISPGVSCFLEIPVPDLNADPTQACALGKSISEKNENLDRFLSELFFPQYISAIKKAIYSYRKSKLPEKFLIGHRIKVTRMPRNSPACYYIPSDLIIIDPDALCIGFDNSSGTFVYGHEFGHRIMAFRSSGLDSALSEASGVLMLSDKHLLTEFLADAFGSMICCDTRSRFMILPGSEQEGLRRVALKLAWS